MRELSTSLNEALCVMPVRRFLSSGRNPANCTEPTHVILHTIAVLACAHLSRRVNTGLHLVVKTQTRINLKGAVRRFEVRLDLRSATPVVLVDGTKRIPLKIPLRWKPWSITTADLSGDGRRSIVVALFKSTRYIPERHNCLFVYRYDGSSVYPVWLGSSLGVPFTELGFGRTAPDRADKLVTLDVGLNGTKSIGVHSWMGFGFRKDRSWGAWRRAHLIGVRDGRVTLLADGKRIDRSLEGK